MANLKLKLKINGLEFEIEGEDMTVKEEFLNFKSFISNDILSKTNIIVPQMIGNSKILTETDKTFTKLIDDIGIDFPILKEIIKKDLPKSESEWVLVYAFYSSEYAQNFFTEKNIKDSYESSGRKTKSRINNISNNIKTNLGKNYIKMHNDTEYVFLSDGVDCVRSILEGKSKNIPSSKTTKKYSPVGENLKTVSVKKSKQTSFVDLNFSAEKLKSIKDFFNLKKPQGQNEEVVVVMKWFKDNTSNIDISSPEISYLLSVCAKIPTALSQVLINIKGGGIHWIQNSSKGKVKLTSIGELYVDESLPKNTK